MSFFTKDVRVYVDTPREDGFLLSDGEFDPCELGTQHRFYGNGG